MQIHNLVSARLVSTLVRFVAVNGRDDGPGKVDRPWATINHAAEQAEAGETVLVRGGHFVLRAQVRLRNSGQPGAWIALMAYPGEEPIFDAQQIPRSSMVEGAWTTEHFQVQNVSYIRMANFKIISSDDAGLSIRDGRRDEVHCARRS